MGEFTDVAVEVHRVAFERVRRCPYPDVRPEAEDIAQEVVASYLEALERGPIDNPEAWANHVAGKRIIDRKRVDWAVELPTEDDSQRSLMFFLVEGLMTSDQAILRETAARLLPLLNEREKELFTLVALGYSHQEIADLMGYANADTVKSTLSRRRRELLRIAEEQGIDTNVDDHPRIY
jgi:RNA polymerase sigma factor (sigma-70 family)